MDILVSPNQVSFVPGGQITDNIVLVQEVIHSMRRKSGKKEFMALKIDLEKAYDRIKWSLAEETLREVGIANKLVDLIMFCLSSS